MRASKRKRPLPRKPAKPPAGADVGAAASSARYVGSAEHKSFPSFAGPPRLRADATRCPPQLSDQDQLTRWLREAIAAEQTSGMWQGGYPRYVWVRVGDACYEARQLAPGSTDYKGYALDKSEWPRDLK